MVSTLLENTPNVTLHMYMHIYSSYAKAIRIKWTRAALRAGASLRLAPAMRREVLETTLVLEVFHGDRHSPAAHL